MELEKFQFQGTFDKIQFIAPLSKGKRIKIIKQIPIKMLNISGRREARLDKKNAVVGQENDV